MLLGGGAWLDVGHDLEGYILILGSFPCGLFQRPWDEQISSAMPIHHAVSVLESANSGLNLLESWHQTNLSSFKLCVPGIVSQQQG